MLLQSRPTFSAALVMFSGGFWPDHDRMPVMLMSEDYDGWLGSNESATELEALLKPYDANLMEAYAERGSSR
jgi:putative SOS response-associated peptidase YedK